MFKQKEVNFEFSEWTWIDRRKKEANDIEDDNRRKAKGYKVKKEHLDSYENNLKWESEQLSKALYDVKNRKYSTIKTSIILFPGLIAGMLAAATYIEKYGSGEDILSSNWYSFYLVSLMAISMFIGMANMVSIKYIAAYKAQANLLIRQINCLRQALDSVTYFKFERKFPVNWRALYDRGSLYFRAFGKHRKLYIGNQEIRNRLIGSYSESADKSLISFLFVTSLTLLSAPFICLASLSLKEWENLSPYQLPLLENQNVLISINMIAIIVAVLLFLVGHWGNFKKLRSSDSYTVNNQNILNKLIEALNWLSIFLFLSFTVYLIYGLFQVHVIEPVQAILTIATILFSCFYLKAQNSESNNKRKNRSSDGNSNKKNENNDDGSNKRKDVNEISINEKPLFYTNKLDYTAIWIIVILAFYWIHLGFYSSIILNTNGDTNISGTEFDIVMITLSILSLFLMIMCINKVFFDALNRIYKSLVYKMVCDLQITQSKANYQMEDSKK